MYDFIELISNAEKETMLKITETKEYQKLIKSFDGLNEHGIKVIDLKTKFE